MKLDPLGKTAYVLLVIGGLNWGLVGVFEYNLVGELFGFDSGLSRIIYVLVGLSALYVIYSLSKVMAEENKS